MLETALDDQIIIAIRRISQAVETYSRFLWQKFGLTAPQLGTLRELQSRASGTPTQIAEWMNISPATTAGILKRLHERHLIERSRDPLDGRGVVVRISDLGAKVAGQAPSLLRDNFREELRRLQSWERTQVLAILQRVASMMNAGQVEEIPFLSNEPAAVKRDAAPGLRIRRRETTRKAAASRKITD